MTPEDALEFGKELGAGAFSTVYEVVHTHTHMLYIPTYMYILHTVKFFLSKLMGM